MTEWMDASEAATALGITRATLYAYVSRGLVHAAPEPGLRKSRYRRREIERLALDRKRTRAPALVARASLDWGRPVLNSELSLVENGRLFYRGRDAVELARTATLEDVAALLWQVDAAAVADHGRPRAAASVLRTLAMLDAPHRCTAGFAWLAALDGRRLPEDPAPARTAARCARLLSLMTIVVTGRAATALPIHRQLARAWVPDGDPDRLRQALVLCADHEFNVSSFTARCVASAGADAAAGVVAGLAALSGSRHGNATSGVERLWARAIAAPAGSRGLRRLIEAELRGDVHGVTGFGHPLYPDGDPRAAAILAGMPAPARNERLVSAVHDLTGARPSLDYALVALRRNLGLPEGHAYLMFALGRTVGWLAHILEQGRDTTLIRPRAAYVGERPAAAAAPAPAGISSRVIRRR
jgi:citrate synthase